MLTFKQFLTEVYFQGVMSAVKYNNKVYHQHGQDHIDIVKRLLKNVPEKNQDKLAQQMEYGYFNPLTNEYIEGNEYWNKQGIPVPTVDLAKRLKITKKMQSKKTFGKTTG